MAKITVGLDVGNSAIKIVALTRSDNNAKLVSLGSIPSPQPGLSADTDEALEPVAIAIKKLIEAAKIEVNEVNGALPESKVFTRVIDELPFLTDQELPQAIKFVSEEFIPTPLSEVDINWQMLYRAPGPDKNARTIVFVVATPKNAVKKYLKVLEMAGLKLKVLETETIAAARSLVGYNPYSPTTLIVQMGATTTDFAVVSRGLIWLTRSISTGGQALTRTLSQYFSFEEAQAEEYKKVYGLMEDQLEGRVYNAIKPVIDVIALEGRRIIQAFQTKYPQNPIKRVVLSGGGAKMPGLVVYFANYLGLEVQEADPWYFVSKEKSIAGRLYQDAPFYSVAVGLALRED